MRGLSIGIAALALFMAVQPDPVIGQKHPVTDWKVKRAFNAKTRALLSCTIGKDNASGIHVSFTLTRKGAWSMTLFKKNWNLLKGRRLKVELIVDDHAPLHVQSIVGSAEHLMTPLGRATRFIEALRRGNALRIKTRDGELAFSLDGSYQAIRLVKLCVTHASTAALTRTLPSNPGRANNRISTVDATVIVGRLLASAGMTGLRLKHPTAGRLQSFDVAWERPDGITGAFFGWRGAKALSLNTAALLLMKSINKTCRRATGRAQKEHAVEHGVDTRRFLITCKDPGNDIRLHVTLAKKSDKVLNIFHFASKKPSHDDALIAEADRSFIASIDWSQLDLR